LLFLLFGEDAFAEIRGIPLRVDSRPASSFDFACAIFLYMRTYNAHAFVLASIDRFLLELLLDEASETRLAAVHIVLALVPHAAFAGTPSLPRGKLFVGDIDFDPTPETPEMLAAGLRILNFLLANRERAVARIAADRVTPSHCIGTYFLRLIAGLARATAFPVADQLVEVARRLVPGRHGFDETVSVWLFSILNGLGVAGEFVPAAFPAFQEPVENGASLVRVLEEFAPHVARIDATDFFAWGFLRFVAFSGHCEILARFDLLRVFLKKFVRDQPERARVFISEHLRWCTDTSFSATLVIVECLGEQVPILQYLLKALTLPQAFTVNELVCRTFAGTTECEGVGIVQIAGLLNSPALEADGRACVWRWLAGHPPEPRAFLAVYRAKRDEEALAEFLIGLNNPDCTQRLLEAARSDVGAFAKSWKYLREVADVFEPNFARSVLALEFRGNWADVAEYAKELFAREGADEATLLRPLVEAVHTRVEFIAEIAGEGGEVTRADVEALISALRVAAEVPQCRERLGHAIARLAATAERVRPADHADEDAVAALKCLAAQFVQ
jgi:hypothetical protein